MFVVADATCAGMLSSVTLAVNVEVPLDAGVPVIAPVEGASVSPAGSLPEVIDHAYCADPPVA
jgi:hypothetical protein